MNRSNLHRYVEFGDKAEFKIKNWCHGNGIYDEKTIRKYTDYFHDTVFSAVEILIFLYIEEMEKKKGLILNEMNDEVINGFFKDVYEYLLEMDRKLSNPDF